MEDLYERNIKLINYMWSVSGTRIFHVRLRDTRLHYYDAHVYVYVYFVTVQPSADTSFSVLMDYRR